MQDQNQQAFRKKLPIPLVLLITVGTVVLLFTFGAIKYGWLFLKAQQITNAARQGARMATLPDINVIVDIIRQQDKPIDLMDSVPDDRPDIDRKEQLIPDDHPDIAKIDNWKLQPLLPEASCSCRMDDLV